jgi:hypothetical protein
MFNFSPKIVNDGLVLALDAANPKSYISDSSVWNDLSPNGNNGTLTNGPTFNSANGGSIVFDGVDDSIRISYNTIMDPTIGITFEAWIYPIDIAGTRHIFRKENNPGRQLFSFQQAATSILAFGTDTVVNGYQELDVPINASDYNNKWIHAVASYTSGFKAIYTNASLIGSDTAITGNLVQNSAPYYIGSNGGSFSFFYGRCSIFKMYNRALSAQEILQNYNATKGRFGLK